MGASAALNFFFAAILAFQTPPPSRCGCFITHPHKPLALKPNADFEMAKRYEALADWKDAEAHYVLAAKDPSVQKQAIDGLERVRRKVDQAETAVLTVGKLYEQKDMWAKAEELYRPVASNASIREDSRKKIADQLGVVLEKQWLDRAFAEGEEWLGRFKSLVELVLILLALGLIWSTWRTIRKRRKIILVHPFAAPTDEVARGVAIQLKYAREMMRRPALSPAAPVPAPLVAALVTFDDEAEPIEDVEIAGSKVPFSALAKIFGQPAIQIRGSFDAVEPMGLAFSAINSYNGRADDFVRHAIRMGVPAVQRSDLRDFAYDVVRKASSAYAVI